MLNITPIETPAYSLFSYIIRDESSGQAIVVDPHPSIIPALPPLADIKAVINTHLHFDHILGNPYFRGKVPVLAHEDEGRHVVYRLAAAGFTLAFSRRWPARISFTLKEGSIITLGKTDIRVLHTPGHSPGSICLYWPGTLISGDTIFVGGVGRTDLPLCDSQAFGKSLRRLMELPEDTLVWPGHNYGPTFPITMGDNRRALVWALNNLG